MSLRVALVASLALLGFLTTYALAGRSHAATRVITTIPNPDPPPPTTTRISPTAAEADLDSNTSTRDCAYTCASASPTDRGRQVA